MSKLGKRIKIYIFTYQTRVKKWKWKRKHHSCHSSDCLVVVPQRLPKQKTMVVVEIAKPSRSASGRSTEQNNSHNEKAGWTGLERIPKRCKEQIGTPRDTYGVVVRITFDATN
jgi:hypothetical protein